MPLPPRTADKTRNRIRVVSGDVRTATNVYYLIRTTDPWDANTREAFAAMLDRLLATMQRCLGQCDVFLAGDTHSYREVPPHPTPAPTNLKRPRKMAQRLEQALDLLAARIEELPPSKSTEEQSELVAAFVCYRARLRQLQTIAVRLRDAFQRTD